MVLPLRVCSRLALALHLGPGQCRQEHVREGHHGLDGGGLHSREVHTADIAYVSELALWADGWATWAHSLVRAVPHTTACGHGHRGTRLRSPCRIRWEGIWPSHGGIPVGGGALSFQLSWRGSSRSTASTLKAVGFTDAKETHTAGIADLTAADSTAKEAHTAGIDVS